MYRKLATSEELEWDVPDKDLFKEVLMTSLATLVESGSRKAAALQWSSVGQATGVGQFAMRTDIIDVVDEYMQLLRDLEHDDLEFESFPKDSLLKTYGV